jgi:hypothetical protein
MGAAGIGGIVGAYFQSFFSRKREIFLKLNSINEERYQNLLYHMNIILNPENVRFMNHSDPSSGKQFNQKDHLDFVKAEYLQSILYAPDNVVNALKNFLKKPNEDNFINTAMKMRISLWNKKTKLVSSEIIIEDKDKK